MPRRKGGFASADVLRQTHGMNTEPIKVFWHPG